MLYKTNRWGNIVGLKLMNDYMYWIEMKGMDDSSTLSSR